MLLSGVEKDVHSHNVSVYFHKNSELMNMLDILWLMIIPANMKLLKQKFQAVLLIASAIERLRRKMSNNRKEYWWVVAYEKSGRIGYLRSECANESEALVKISELQKSEPNFRYVYFQVR